MAWRKVDVPKWWQWAACKGMDTRYFIPDMDSSWREAHRRISDPQFEVCKGCMVRRNCLDEAVANRELGIWGGTTERERTKLRRLISGTGIRIDEVPSDYLEEMGLD